jgi:hypothetical protein
MSYNKLLYESKEEYAKLCDNFKNALPFLIRNNNIDDWTYNGKQFGLSISTPLETVLEQALTKLSKNQNELWVNNMTDILSCAVRGLAKSVSYMNKFKIPVECDNDFIYVNIQDNFKNREICNIMVINVINAILFDEDDDGYSLGGADGVGQIEKIIQFRCKRCNEFCNMVGFCDLVNIRDNTPLYI